MKIFVTEGSGNSIKPVLAAHQIGRAIEVAFMDVLGGKTREPAFLALNPAGNVPFAITDTGQHIGESNAILWLVCEGSRLIPDTPFDRAAALQWMFFEQNTLEPSISPARFVTRIVPSLGQGKETEIAAWRDKARRGLSRLDDHLRGRQFLTDGGYCCADIAVFGYTHLADEAGVALAEYPAVCDWIARVKETDRFLPISTLLNPEFADRIAK